jgi:periplasmic protein TonB
LVDPDPAVEDAQPVRVTAEPRLQPGTEERGPNPSWPAILAATLLYLCFLGLPWLLASVAGWEPQPPENPVPVKLIFSPPPAAKPEPVAPEIMLPPDHARESGPGTQTTAPAPPPKRQKAPASPRIQGPRAETKPESVQLSEKSTPNAPGTSPSPRVTKPQPRPASARPRPIVAAAAAAAPKPGRGHEFRVVGPREETGDPYLNAVRDLLERHRFYPPLARSMGLAGEATYLLAIDRSGEQLGLKLIQSSGAEILDHAAWTMITETGRLPPPSIPKPGQFLVIQITVPVYPD